MYFNKICHQETPQPACTTNYTNRSLRTQPNARIQNLHSLVRTPARSLALSIFILNIMIIKHKSRKIKLIPVKYLVIENITDFLENEDQLRLTEAERCHLDKALFFATYNRLIASLEKQDPELYDKVKDSNPMYAVKFKANGQRTIFIIRTDNNISLQCSKQLYKLCPNKRKNATQLTLF